MKLDYRLHMHWNICLLEQRYTVQTTKTTDFAIFPCHNFHGFKLKNALIYIRNAIIFYLKDRKKW